MKTLLGLLLAIGSLGLPACGGKDAAVVGTWAMDIPSALDANVKEELAKQAKELADAPADQRAALKANQRDEATLRKHLEDFMSLMNVTIEFRADQTAAFQLDGPMGGGKAATGTWSQSGNKVTLTMKTRDGKEVTGKAAEPTVMTLHGDRLTFRPEPELPEMTLRRK